MPTGSTRRFGNAWATAHQSWQRRKSRWIRPFCLPVCSPNAKFSATNTLPGHLQTFATASSMHVSRLVRNLKDSSPLPFPPEAERLSRAWPSPSRMPKPISCGASSLSSRICPSSSRMPPNTVAFSTRRGAESYWNATPRPNRTPLRRARNCCRSISSPKTGTHQSS